MWSVAQVVLEPKDLALELKDLGSKASADID